VYQLHHPSLTLPIEGRGPEGLIACLSGLRKTAYFSKMGTGFIAAPSGSLAKEGGRESLAIGGVNGPRISQSPRRSNASFHFSSSFCEAAEGAENAKDANALELAASGVPTSPWRSARLR
jgi:hypothetical protein